MAQASQIEWTDATWNPVTGCTRVGPGCENCYAERFAERWRGVEDHPYEQGFDLRQWPAPSDGAAAIRRRGSAGGKDGLPERTPSRHSRRRRWSKRPAPCATSSRMHAPDSDSKTSQTHARYGTDQNPGIHLYTHERVRPEAYGARAVQLTWAQPRLEISAAWARADNRAA